MTRRERIDRYEIEEIIGRGSMGVVYRARDPVIGREIAIKTIQLSEEIAAGLHEDSGQRFTRELRAGGVLSHPNIVTVYDAGNLEDRSSAYMAMEYVEGTSLRDRIRSGSTLAPEEVLDVALQVARALDYAHARGIIHRDVKPGNILLRHDGLVKLADFGIAQYGPSDLTATGSSIGSPSYIAPEALEGRGGPRADLFSLGVVVYEALTGARPFTGETLPVLYRQILEVDPIPPSDLRPSLPVGWDRVIGRLLEKNPEARYPTAADLIEDLRLLERGEEPRAEPAPAGLVRAAPVPEEPPPEAPSHGISPAMIGAAVVVVVAFVAALLIGRSGLAVPRNERVEAGDQRGEVWGSEGVAVAPAAEHGAAVEESLEPPGPVEATPPPASPRPKDPAPAPRPDPGPAAARDPVPSRARPEPRADLTVRLTAPPATERFELLVDGRILIAETFDPDVSKQRREPTTLSRTIDLPAGHHWFEVRVSDRRGRLVTESEGRAIGADTPVTLHVEMKGAFRRKVRMGWE